MHRYSCILAAFACAIAFIVAAPAEERAQPEPLRLSRAERLILDLTNKARAARQLSALRPNPTLFAVARPHSANMARHGKMAHQLDGKGPAERVRAAGYPYWVVGENVAYGSANVSVASIFDGWMHSPHHRDNILHRDFEDIGIGIADKNGYAYYTQVFGATHRLR